MFSSVLALFGAGSSSEMWNTGCTRFIDSGFFFDCEWFDLLVVKFLDLVATNSRDYRAVYITERTVKDLTKKIAEKRQIDPKHVARLLHVK